MKPRTLIPILANGRKSGRKPPHWMLLSEAHREKLFFWMTSDNLTYQKTVARARSELGFSIQPSALAVFWKEYCAPRLLPMAERQSIKANPVVCELVIQIRAGGGVQVSQEGTTP